MKFVLSNRFFLMSLGVMPACLVGVGIMVLLGASRTMPVMNLTTAVVGLVGIGFGVANGSRWIQRYAFAVALATVALLYVTLFNSGMDGVFRWVRLGPMRLHLASLFTPALFWAWMILWERQKTFVVSLLVAATFVLHIVQPDAGQATALAAGILALVCLPDKRRKTCWILAGLSLLGMLFAWSRRDPLHGVDFVEHIVPQAWSYFPGLGILAVGALGMLPLTSGMIAYAFRKNQFTRNYGTALTAYFAASILVAASGVFPTPVLGFGASPILGALLGLGLLAQSSSGRIDASALDNAAML